ncbi:MAG: tetratricopeptide repeat protein [Candidatus Binatia bacterium]
MQDITDSQNKDLRLVAFFLFLATIIAYLPAMYGGFIFDDKVYITENQFLRTTAGLLQIWLHPTSAPQYYPLTFTTFWLEFQLWGLWPTGYHLVNVLLHAANAILLFLLCRTLAIPGAWLVAAIFALHPVQVESVAWVAERKNVLSGFFYFASLLCYLRFSSFQAPSQDFTRPLWRYYYFALVLFFCALLSKTATCTLPAVLLLIHWWKRGTISRNDILLLAPLFIMGLLMGIGTTILEKEVSGAIGSDWDFSLTERFLIAGRAWWFYVSKLFWPTSLTFIYPQWTVDSGSWWQYLFPAASLIVLVVFALFHRRIGRAPAVATLFFSGTLAPVLGFFNVYFMRYSYVADHFQYLASVGVIALVAGLWWREPSLLPARLQALGFSLSLPMSVFHLRASGRSLLSLCLVGCLGFLTWRQAHIYIGPETLWSDTLQKDPGSWIAYNNLGILFLEKKDYPQAIQRFQSAISVKPDLAEAQSNLSLALLREGKIDAAIEHGLQAVRLEPASSKLHSILGTAFWRKGDVSQAAAYFRNAISHEPVVPQAHYNLGLLYMKEASAFQNIPPREAITHFEQALVLNHRAIQTVYTLAWILATHPDASLRDGAKAVQLAQEACERTNYRDPVLLDTLAAAYAEAGRFQDAIQIERTAVQIASQQKQEQQHNQITSRLQLYQSGQPYREAPTQQERSQRATE